MTVKKYPAPSIPGEAPAPVAGGVHPDASAEPASTAHGGFDAMEHADAR